MLHVLEVRSQVHYHVPSKTEIQLNQIKKKKTSGDFDLSKYIRLKNLSISTNDVTVNIMTHISWVSILGLYA